MKRCNVIPISISVLGMLVTLALSGPPLLTQERHAVLRFAPPALELAPGAWETVYIFIQDVQDLYGLEFQLAFDPNVVKVVDADPDKAGVQIWPADWWKDGFVAVNQVDNEIGRIDFAATLLRPALPASGTRAIAVISFKARETGSSTLRVESAILSTRNAEVIAYTKQPGSIVVNGSDRAPEVRTNNLSAGLAPGRLALAGAALLALIAALGGFIYALRRR